MRLQTERPLARALPSMLARVLGPLPTGGRQGCAGLLAPTAQQRLPAATLDGGVSSHVRPAFPVLCQALSPVSQHDRLIASQCASPSHSELPGSAAARFPRRWPAARRLSTSRATTMADGPQPTAGETYCSPVAYRSLSLAIILQECVQRAYGR